MQRRTLRVALVTASACFLLACDSRGREQRLQRLEERVSAFERAPGTATTSATTPSPVDDLRSLERRLAAVEQRVASLGPTPPAGPAEVAQARLEQRRERRARLRDLTDQYRARLSSIRQEQADPAARQQAVREALEWYRDQRRAILAGQEPVAPQ